MLLVDVDRRLPRSARAGRPAASVLKQHLRPRHRQLEALAPHGLDQNAELQFAAAGDLHGVLLGAIRTSAARRCLPPRAAAGRGSRGSCTLSPSVPASGESLMRKVMTSVGGSIGCAGSGSTTSGAQSVCDDGAPPAGRRWRRCRRRSASSIGTRSRPRKARTLVTRPSSISSPLRIEHLDRLVGLHRAREDAAGDDAAEIGIGLQDGAEHAERAVLDLRRLDMAEDEIEQRRHALVLRALRARAPSSPAWPSRRGSGNRAAPRSRRARRRDRTPR